MHDLNVLHDGSDFTGPLRIHLRSAIPRFILRYRLLQEQISRLDLAAGVDENVAAEGLYSSSAISKLSLNVVAGYAPAVQHDAAPEADQHEEEAQLEAEHREEEDADHHDEEGVDHHGEEAQHKALLLGDQNDLDGTEGVHEAKVSLDLLQGDDTLAKDMAFIPQAVADVAYHSVSGDVAQALEGEDDYEGTNVGTEYQEEGEGDHDTAAVHQTADTDATATVSGVDVQFEGEEGEYQDFIQPEEYGEIYEDFPEEDGTHTEFGYDQTVGYEDSGTSAVPTTVEESQTGLPVSDLHEEETTLVPPTQHIDSEPAQISEIGDRGNDEDLDQHNVLDGEQCCSIKHARILTLR